MSKKQQGMLLFLPCTRQACVQTPGWAGLSGGALACR